MVKEPFIALIDKYLAGTATASEQLLVEEYLTRLEANGNTNIIPDSRQEEDLKESMWQQIQLQTKQQTAQVVQMRWYRRKAFRSIAVAASIVLVIGLGISVFTNDEPNRQAIVVKNDKRTDSNIISFVHHEINTTGREKRIQLSDGSLIVLADKSEVTYRQPFVDLRDVTLIGKAYFKVAKDQMKPFRVISGNISTTALGTEFTVTAFAKANRIIVRLYEGKVVVKALSNTDRRMKKDVYLLPGQQFIYDKGSSKAKSFKLKNVSKPEQILKEELRSDDPFIPKEKGSWYMFNNQSLSQVLDDLAALYNVEIIYEKKDVQNIYFTARYNKFDSIETILKRIGTLNQLTITKNDSAYIISK